MLYCIRYTNCIFFSLTRENTLVKSVFSLFSYRVGESLCSNNRGKHFFGAYDFGCAHFLFCSVIMVVTFCRHAQYTETGEDEEKIISLLTEIIGDRHAELYLGGYGSFRHFVSFIFRNSLTNPQKCGTIISLHKSNKTFYECAFLLMVKMHTPFSAFLVKVVKICVATIGDAFFVRL